MAKQVEENLSQEYVTELKQMRFLFTNETIFVNCFEPLAAERLKVWDDWLKNKYPSKRVVFV